MRLAPALGFLGTTTLFASALFVAACTGDDSNGPAADSGTTTGSDATSTTDGNTGTDGNTPVADAGPDSHTPASDAGDAGDSAIPLDCNDYCTAVMNACQGSQAQYQTKDECLTACQFFPVGTAGDTTGDTLGCRAYHAVLAATLPNPHCWHAGPYGSSVCGASCDDFCEITLGYCSPDAGLDGGAPPYASLSDCKTACAGFALAPVDAGPDASPPPSAYNAGGTNDTGNTLDCREYHLGLALTNAANQQIHCPHTAATSAVCK